MKDYYSHHYSFPHLIYDFSHRTIIIFVTISCIYTIVHTNENILADDIRRSKQQNSVQNALYNFGSSFNQYQPQKQTTTTTSTTTTTTTTTTPRNILATRKSLVTTTSPYFAVKANPLVLAPANSNSTLKRNILSFFLTQIKNDKLIMLTFS